MRHSRRSFLGGLSGAAIARVVPATITRGVIAQALPIRAGVIKSADIAANSIRAGRIAVGVIDVSKITAARIIEKPVAVSLDQAVAGLPTIF